MVCISMQLRPAFCIKVFLLSLIGSAAKNSQKAPKGKKRKITDFID